MWQTILHSIKVMRVERQSSLQCPLRWSSVVQSRATDDPDRDSSRAEIFLFGRPIRGHFASKETTTKGVSTLSIPLKPLHNAVYKK